MSEPFFQYINNNRQTISNSLYGQEEVPYKYDHHAYIPLPKIEEPDIKLIEALRHRRSVRSFSSNQLSLEDLSGLLKLSIGRQDNNQGLEGYPFPSGGGLYPIETYLLLHNTESLENGLYHYYAPSHSVAQLSKCSYTNESLNALFGMEFEGVPQAIILMTMVKSRGIKKYGSLTYFLSLIEAGHRGQNISLCVNAFKMGCCSMGTTNYEQINNLLQVDGVNEHYIYSIATGSIR